ncbi:hypothetical protein [Paenibacillus mucilaginosus]|uniref:Uncharacterized protein n=1 Tax=Paenibacillus mucilaginosus (strain KNP414) TaxID=1036673 RepID=F8FNF3_PAEMK|nr:hypothetical protein [Paenibacillus mucilaginosus]AEI38990.1 hypothetical protein KNP414_00365 [Paenibacillus mucilaginosus KNP414]
MSPNFPPPAGSSAVLPRPNPGRMVFTAQSPAAAPASAPTAEPLLLPAGAYGELQSLLAAALVRPADAAGRLRPPGPRSCPPAAGRCSPMRPAACPARGRPASRRRRSSWPR